MKAKNLIAAATLFAATSSVFAAEWGDFSDFKSTKTRADVIAELKGDEGKDAVHTEYVETASNVASGGTRAAIKAELKQSQVDGSYAVLHQEYEGQFRGADTGRKGPQLAKNAGSANRN